MLRLHVFEKFLVNVQHSFKQQRLTSARSLGLRETSIISMIRGIYIIQLHFHILEFCTIKTYTQLVQMRNKNRLWNPFCATCFLKKAGKKQRTLWMNVHLLWILTPILRSKSLKVYCVIDLLIILAARPNYNIQIWVVLDVIHLVSTDRVAFKPTAEAHDSRHHLHNDFAESGHIPP